MSTIPAPPTTLTTPLPTTEEILPRRRGENFPVALRALPAPLRADLEALYSFARLVDFVGDEYAGDRGAALDRLAAELDAALAGGRPPEGASSPVAGVAAMVARRRLDPRALYDLVAANRMDQEVASYATFEDLMGYCALSANPVGRLVLGIFGVGTPRRVALSDSVCSGLQLAEHWQDVAEDAAAGRVYVPVEDLERFGVTASDLTAGAAGPAPGTPAVGGPTRDPAGPRLRALMAFEAARAGGLLAAGDALVASLRGWARVAVAGYVAGGRAALDALAAARFDPRAGAPRPTTARTAWHAARLLAGRHRGDE
jgi:squalene synthase HpnC